MYDRLRFRPVAIVVATAGLMASSPAFANDCDALLDAIKATYKLTYRTTASRIGADGKATEMGHVVQSPEGKYVEVRGTWHKIETDNDEMVKEAEKDIAAGKMTCTKAGSETYKGKSATVYAVHTEKEDTKSDAKVWVDDKQRFLKAETKLHGTNTSMVAEYDYDNVEIPKNASPLGRPAPKR